MKAPQQLLLLSSVVFGGAEAYGVAPSSRSSFVGQPAAAVHASSPTTMLRMDLEQDAYVARYELDELIQKNGLHSSKKVITLDEAQAAHGMPWKSSIDPKMKDEKDLLYMPFWEWQIQFMKDNLTNLKVVPCSNGKTDFSFNENKDKKARIVNLCASSSEYKKIRMTYYDAGEGAQVFNAVWYPDPKYNLPILGIDVLAFNRKKYLAIVDFQPLHDSEDKHAATYEHVLEPIKEKYGSLKGRMSSKFYDETQFFSQQMLFSRFEDESVVDRELFPAFQQYVETHLDLIRSTEPSADDVDFVSDRQKAYDTYSAERDPATGLFAAMFGGDWAQDFVHDFLFSSSERKEGAAPPAMPFMGGGGPPSQHRAQQPEEKASRKPAFIGARR